MIETIKHNANVFYLWISTCSNEPPVITNADKRRHIAENSEANSIIIGDSMTFADVDVSDKSVTWTAVGVGTHAAASESAIRIDENDGKFYVWEGATINFEDLSILSFDVTATDAGGMSDTRRVDITVTDVNEPPTISGGVASIPEDAIKDDEVLRVSMSDVDAGSSLECEVYPVHNLFYAEELCDKSQEPPRCEECVVKVKQLLDHESVDSATLTVKVTDRARSHDAVSGSEGSGSNWVEVREQ